MYNLVPKGQKPHITVKGGLTSLTLVLLLSSHEGIVGYQLTENTMDRFLWLHHIASYLTHKISEDPEYLKKNDLVHVFDN